MVVSGVLILAVIAGVQTVQYREVSKSREERAASLEERKRLDAEWKGEMERAREDREIVAGILIRVLRELEDEHGNP